MKITSRLSTCSSASSRRVRSLVLLGRRRRQHVDGIADAGRRRQELVADRSRVASLRAASSSPCASQASAARIAGPPALDRIATRGPAGSGWCASSAATSNSSSSVAVRMTPACAEQRVDDHVARGQRAGVRRGRSRARPRSAGLDGDDRLLLGDAAGDLREPARITEALEVQQDDVGSRIVGPVLDQVVARHVGLVADRHERGDPEIELPHVVENREAERAALRRERRRVPRSAPPARTSRSAGRRDRC